jgi:hypothetical protein
VGDDESASEIIFIPANSLRIGFEDGGPCLPDLTKIARRSSAIGPRWLATKVEWLIASNRMEPDQLTVGERSAWTLAV